MRPRHVGFFGPTGVGEDARGTGIGKALLFKCLESLKELGHVYGVIGGVGAEGVLSEGLWCGGN